MSPVFFTDRDLGAKIFPDRLRQAGLTVEAHTDHFPQDAPDEVWLPEAAERGWVILTADQAILRTTLERDSLMIAGAAAFVLVGGDAPTLELAENFVNTLARVEGTLSATNRPFIAKIYRPSPRSLIWRGRPGRIEVKLTRANWTPRPKP